MPIFLQRCANVGISVKTLDTFRSKDEQNNISAANTKARWPNSMHNWGVAFDWCPVDKNGNFLWNREDLFNKCGAIGKALGLIWGGDFKTIVGDLGHLQLADYGWKPSDVLIPKFRSPENFIATWPKGDDEEVQTQKVKIKLNGQIVYAEKEVPVIDGHIYLPLRELAEKIMDAQVDYKDNTINIITGGK